MAEARNKLVRQVSDMTDHVLIRDEILSKKHLPTTERRIRIDTVRDKRKNGVQREIVGTTAGLSAGQPQPLNLLPHLLSLHQWRHPYAISSGNVLD